MSISLMKDVFDNNEMSHCEKLVMLALADNANDEGICYPSLTTISKKTSLSRVTVVKHTKELAKKNYLWSKNRSRKKGGRSSNIYLLFPLKKYINLDESHKEKFTEFHEIHSQSSKGELGVQSSRVELANDSQSSKGELESEPSLNKTLFNHHLYVNLSNNEKALFLEYLKMRTAMKLKTTLSIQERLLKKYHEYGRNMEVIEKAINSNWRDFYQSKPNNQYGGNNGTGISREEWNSTDF